MRYYVNCNESIIGCYLSKANALRVNVNDVRKLEQDSRNIEWTDLGLPSDDVLSIALAATDILSTLF
jgi:hypothetical protein